MKSYKIASIAGDGIGKEVLPEGIEILKETAKKHQFQINFDEFDFASCDYYKKNGKMLPDDWKEKIGKSCKTVEKFEKKQHQTRKHDLDYGPSYPTRFEANGSIGWWKICNF